MRGLQCLDNVGPMGSVGMVRAKTTLLINRKTEQNDVSYLTRRDVGLQNKTHGTDVKFMSHRRETIKAV